MIGSDADVLITDIINIIELHKVLLILKPSQNENPENPVTPMHFIPSVSFILTPPDLNASWYAGKVVVSLKDAIFQPTTAFRYAAEVMMRIKK